MDQTERRTTTITTTCRSILSLCLLCVGSRVSPNIFGLMLMGYVVLFICIESCVLYCVVSGMNRVHVVLSGLRMRCLSVPMYVFFGGTGSENSISFTSLIVFTLLQM